MAASVASVAAVEAALTPGLIEGPLAAGITAAGLLVLDANLTAAAVSAAAVVAAAHRVPVLFEPVSVPKSTR